MHGGGRMQTCKALTDTRLLSPGTRSMPARSDASFSDETEMPRSLSTGTTSATASVPVAILSYLRAASVTLGLALSIFCPCHERQG